MHNLHRIRLHLRLWVMKHWWPKIVKKLMSVEFPLTQTLPSDKKTVEVTLMSALINSLRQIKSRISSYTMTLCNNIIATKSCKLLIWKPKHWFSCQFQILTQICRLWHHFTISLWILVRSFNSSKPSNPQVIQPWVTIISALSVGSRHLSRSILFP